MRIASLAVLSLAGSCAPSDSFPVAEFLVACPSLQPAIVGRTLRTFAKEQRLQVDLLVNSPVHIRMRMDGSRFGQDIFIEYWATGDMPETTDCREKGPPCIDVVAFTGGLIPDEENKEDVAHQEKTAGALKDALEGICER